MNETEELIGIFGTLCDHMVDNGRCDVFCPYAETKDKDDECEAWRTIQKIRQGKRNEKPEIAVCDYISSMTDRYAIGLYEDLYIPFPWSYK
jgi:dGTP triphosphohydrolase